MASITVTRVIEAPADVVFRTVADIGHFSQAVPHIVKVEFLSELKSGVGTRFRETRLMNGREASTELEVTEHVENDHVRIVSDAGGAIWDTVFTVSPSGKGTELTMVMDARPQTLAARLAVPLMLRMVKGAVARDMDAVKTFCERPAAVAAAGG
jgi:carbon monoxide dehydrogenase subunit G